MLQETERWAPKETGGVLMGYKTNKEVCIIKVIGPGPKAVHERFSFTPDYDFHEAEIARIYNETNRKVTYLGDWHSHPGAAAYLSSKDKRVIRTIADFKEAYLSEPLMLIIGTFPFEVRTWLYTSKKYLKTGTIKEIPVSLKH